MIRGLATGLCRLADTVHSRRKHSLQPLLRTPCAPRLRLAGWRGGGGGPPAILLGHTDGRSDGSWLTLAATPHCPGPAPLDPGSPGRLGWASSGTRTRSRSARRSTRRVPRSSESCAATRTLPRSKSTSSKLSRDTVLLRSPSTVQCRFCRPRLDTALGRSRACVRAHTPSSERLQSSSSSALREPV